jgi:hypothetical protein
MKPEETVQNKKCRLCLWTNWASPGWQSISNLWEVISSRSRPSRSLLQCSHLHLAFPLLPAHQNNCDQKHYTSTRAPRATDVVHALTWCTLHAGQRVRGEGGESAPSLATFDAVTARELQPVLRAANITNQISTKTARHGTAAESPAKDLSCYLRGGWSGSY